MIESNYEDSKSISRRINDMKNWLKKPSLIQPDSNAQYEEIIEIDLAKVKQPIVACPNDPDNVKEITDVANTNIDEVFIGSCMTNIGHYRAAAKVLEGVQNLKAKLWICPPTKMDEETLKAEGYYKIFEYLKSKNIDVIIDDTEENISAKIRKFNLIGIPYQLILGNKTDGDLFEFKEINGETQKLNIEEVASQILKAKSN